jgi:hypothetical protein
MLDAELETVIDWSKDEDVLAPGKKTDEDVLAKGWCNAKISGTFDPENSLLHKELTLIIAFDAHRRRSLAYDHFDATIVRVARQLEGNAFFQYEYACKLGHTGCRITQKRNAPTDKLLHMMKTCNATHQGEPSKPEIAPVKYDPVHHRMLAAMRCAASNRPFLSMEDYFYKLELQHVRPGKSFHLIFNPLSLLPRNIIGITTDTF